MQLHPRLPECLGRKLMAVTRKIAQRLLHSQRRLDIVGGGVRVDVVIVISVELDRGDIAFEIGDRPRSRIFLAPKPYRIQASIKNIRKRVDILVPRSIEVAEEKKIVVLQRLGGLLRGKPGEGIPSGLVAVSRDSSAEHVGERSAARRCLP